jgi:hypothetical protein
VRGKGEYGSSRDAVPVVDMAQRAAITAKDMVNTILMGYMGMAYINAWYVKGWDCFSAQDAKARAGSLLTVEYAIFVTEKEECEGDKAGGRSIYMESQEKVKDKIKNRAPPTLPPVKAVPSVFYSG